MTAWLTGNDIGAMAIVLACGLFVVMRFTSDHWKRRFRAIASPLLNLPGHRALFILVVVGMLLVSTVPEAALVLPALDAIGLDLVTVLVALELRHYLGSLARLVRIPARVAVRANPVFWVYECMWLVIGIRTVMGKMSAAAPARNGDEAVV